MAASASHQQSGHAADHNHAAHQRRSDPTRTKTARNRFAQHLRGRWDAISYHLRRGLIENDALGLDAGDGSLSLTANVETDPSITPGTGELARDTTAETAEAFAEWLDDAIDQEILAEYDGDRYIRKGAERGIAFADARLREEGVDVPDDGVQAALRRPVHRDKLELMFERAYEELQGVTQATAQQLRRELTEGLAQGLNPRDIARRLTDRVEAIGKTRATVLARTEVIRTHTESTLDRYEQIAGDDVGIVVQAELSTAGDNRVCPVCAALEGRTQERALSIDEVRQGTFTFDPDDAEIIDSLRGEFPQAPPIHPQCRCVLLPVVS